MLTPYDEEKIKNFNSGTIFGRYCVRSFWKSVLNFINQTDTKISPEVKKTIEKEYKKWEWLWYNSNEQDYPIPIEEWEKRNG